MQFLNFFMKNLILASLISLSAPLPYATSSNTEITQNINIRSQYESYPIIKNSFSLNEQFYNTMEKRTTVNNDILILQQDLICQEYRSYQYSFTQIFSTTRVRTKQITGDLNIYSLVRNSQLQQLPPGTKRYKKYQYWQSEDEQDDTAITTRLNYMFSTTQNQTIRANKLQYGNDLIGDYLPDYILESYTGTDAEEVFFSGEIAYDRNLEHTTNYLYIFESFYYVKQKYNDLNLDHNMLENFPTNLKLTGQYILTLDPEQPTGITTEVVDIPGLMYTILTLPFAFISQAFNFTFFTGTIYEINITHIVFLIVVAGLVIFLVRKLIK